MSDGVVRLEVMTPEDAVAHLAGEDELIVRFLTRVPSTISPPRCRTISASRWETRPKSTMPASGTWMAFTPAA